MSFATSSTDKATKDATSNTAQAGRSQHTTGKLSFTLTPICDDEKDDTDTRDAKSDVNTNLPRTREEADEIVLGTFGR